MGRRLNASMGARRSRVAAGGINGLDDITNMTHWWDASDEASITDTSGSVDQIDDKIGSFDLVDGGASLQPETGNATHDQNGLNSVHFDDDKLHGTFSPSATFWFIMACDLMSVATSNDALVSLYDNTGGRVDIWLQANNASQFNGRTALTGTSTTTNWTGGPYSGNLIIEILADATSNTIDVEIDGSSVHSQLTDYTTDFTIDTFSLLSYFPWNTGPEARFFECGFMDGNLPTAQDRTDARSYLTTKWNL